MNDNPLPLLGDATGTTVIVWCTVDLTWKHVTMDQLYADFKARLLAEGLV